MSKIYIRGGIGDFLQCLPYVVGADAGDEFFIHTHYKKAEQFFSEFGIKNAKYFYFNDAEEHDKTVDDILAFCDPKLKTTFANCPRSFYFDLEFGDDAVFIADDFASSFPNKNPVIGIHPFGSGFSSGIYSKFSLPIKHIPVEILIKLVRENSQFNFFIFGAANEFASYSAETLSSFSNVRLVTFDNIINSLACAKKCVKMIATDSCFKTLSSSHKIPTYCLVGDFDDPTRDAFFIDKYVADGIMKIFKYKNALEQKDDIYKFFSDAIKT